MTTPAAAPPARPEPDAIGVAQDTIIGVAFAVPGVSVGITLAALAAATAYASGLVMADVLSLGVAPAAQDRSLIAVLAAGAALMAFARYGLRSAFFRVPRDTGISRHAR